MASKFICGLFDEHEFMGQMPPHYGEVAYGPYDTAEEARAVARTLSSDPDEAVVLELVFREPPCANGCPPGGVHKFSCEFAGRPV